MRPFRKNIAIAVDGGGIKGVIVTQALSLLEEELGKPVRDIFRLAAGTSTGSIISAGIASGISAKELTLLYKEIGPKIFAPSWRKDIFPLSRIRYSGMALQAALETYFGNKRMGDYWLSNPSTDVVITTFDLLENRTRFIKPWKAEYADWPVVKAVQSSCTVPTYFPVVEGRYVDGGVGSYANPCYTAAYEASFCLGWDPDETTLISIGTGRSPHHYEPVKANALWPWQWLTPIADAFLQSAYDQQVHLVENFFHKIDFRRFQIDLREPIEMDDVSRMDQLIAYGTRLGRMILNDTVDRSQGLKAKKAPPHMFFNHQSDGL